MVYLKIFSIQFAICFSKTNFCGWDVTEASHLERALALTCIESKLMISVSITALQTKSLALSSLLLGYYCYVFIYLIPESILIVHSKQRGGDPRLRSYSCAVIYLLGVRLTAPSWP